MRGLGIAAGAGRDAGRVFGNLYGAVRVAAALSYVAGSVLLDHTSAPVTLVVAGGLGTAATIVTAAGLRRNGLSWRREV